MALASSHYWIPWARRYQDHHSIWHVENANPARSCSQNVQKRYFQSIEPMTGTNNLFSRENVLFVMLIRRKEADSDICCSSVEPLMFFVCNSFVCKYRQHKYFGLILTSYFYIYITNLLYINNILRLQSQLTSLEVFRFSPLRI